MTSRPNKNDISIGEGVWVTFGELAGEPSHVIEIDPQLAAVLPFIETLETECVSECCGINAFVLWPEEIGKAAGGYTGRERDALLSAFAVAYNTIEGLPCDTVASMRLNQLFRKSVFLEVLAHIRQAVESGSDAPPNPAQ